jgi:predicted secreted protein
MGIMKKDIKEGIHMMNLRLKSIIATVTLILLAVINIGGTYAMAIPDNDNIYILKERPNINLLNINDCFVVQLNENISTGYSWQYKISNPEIIKFVEITHKQNKNPFNIVGAPSESIWKFQGIAAGNCQIDFKYYRSWEGEKSATKSRIYDVTIANKETNP